jgi:hypothetical protein
VRSKWGFADLKCLWVKTMKREILISKKGCACFVI